MAIAFDPQEYIASLGSGNMNDPRSNISAIQDYVANNNRNYGTGLQNNMSMTDPTFTSGLNYARSIAGGQNVPNMIAPGVSYSAARPQGFTQADLNVPATPMVTSTPDDPAFLPGGSAVNPPDYTNLPPNIIGGGRGDNISILDDRRFPPPRNLLEGYKPLDLTGIQGILDSLKQDKVDLPNFDDFVMKKDLQVPNGRDFSVEDIREDLRLPDFENFVMKDNVPTYDDSDIRDLIAKNTTGINSIPDFNPNDYRDNFLSIAREGIDIPSYDDTELKNLIAGNTTGINSIPAFDPSSLNLPDFGNFATKDDLPIFNPQDYRDDFLSIAREGIDIPRYEMPDVSQFITKDDLPRYEIPDVSQFITKDDLPTFQEPNLDDLYKRLDALENQPMIPNGSDFSISRPQLGLFG